MNISARAGQVDEFVVNATVDELNAALSERSIDADQILSVIFLPEAALAIGDAEAKFRVLFKTQVQ
jgi:hypothetical protein